ncbi:unnamed protein product [Prunus armeniaca]
MKNNAHTQIMAYTDANWVGNAIDRKYTTGYCIDANWVGKHHDMEEQKAKCNCSLKCRN